MTVDYAELKLSSLVVAVVMLAAVSAEDLLEGHMLLLKLPKVPTDHTVVSTAWRLSHMVAADQMFLFRKQHLPTTSPVRVLPYPCRHTRRLSY